MDSKTPFLIRVKTLWKTLTKGLSVFIVFILNKISNNKFSNTTSNSHSELQKSFDKKLVYSLSKSRIPTFKQLKYLSRYLNAVEKRILNLSLFLLVSSLLFLGARFYYTHLEVAPIIGGEYREALIGAPQTVNPLYVGRNDVDDDLSQLIFSSLFKRGTNGELNKDLVEDFFVSEDSRVYDITIRKDVKWHNGKPMTASDVVFTFNAISDPLFKSSLRLSFGGVSIEQIDDYNLKFILKEPYAAFLDLLTFGVLPSELWAQVSPETATLASLNLKPIGSGPYKFDSLIRDESGLIKNYKLEINTDYYNKPPFLNINFVLFPNFEEALNSLNNSDVDAMSYLPAEMKGQITNKSLQFNKIFFPQITLIFFNQQANPALADKSVRQALALALDKRAIINDVLDRDAYIVDSPILANSFAYDPNIKKYPYNKDEANKLLEKVDWKNEKINAEILAKANTDLNSKDEVTRKKAESILKMGQGVWRKKNGEYFQITLSTVERKENSEMVAAIKKYWEEIGVKVNTEIVPGSRIQGEIIKPRNFEALFYAQVLGSDPDPYAFWHSSQAEKGFNIANYINKEADKLLEEARLTAETSVRQEKYKKFQSIIAEDEPVIFMYSPHYTYVQSNNVKGFNVQNILTPKDRFANISDWYIKTGKKLNWNKKK